VELIRKGVRSRGYYIDVIAFPNKNEVESISMSLKSFVKPHPNPLLTKEREHESCFSSGIFGIA